jgi:hypothetical protein
MNALNSFESWPNEIQHSDVGQDTEVTAICSDASSEAYFIDASSDSLDPAKSTSDCINAWSGDFLPALSLFEEETLIPKGPEITRSQYATHSNTTCVPDSIELVSNTDTESVNTRRSTTSYQPVSLSNHPSVKANRRVYM